MTKHELQKQISENIRSAIEEYGVTQEYLARKSGVSTSTISRYLDGDIMPSVPNLINIANVLECEISEIIDADEMIDIKKRG